ncbi:MAG: hypothetical protein AABW84_02410 [Nanoarchaeota archaeon]
MVTRGQANIIGFLLIVAISTSLIATVYLWAWPNIEKAQNVDEVMRIENRFSELHSAIKKAANEQTTTATPFTIKKGTIWVDGNNSIHYEANLKLDVPFQPQTIIGNKTEFGILGINDVGYLERSASVKYRLHYIVLRNPDVEDFNNHTIVLFSNQTQLSGQIAAGPGDHTIVARWLKENRSYTVPFSLDGTGAIVNINTIAQFIEIDII